MFGSYLYWITVVALLLCLLLSLLRRQTLKQLAEARGKLLDERQGREQMRAELVHVRNTAEKDLAAAKKQVAEATRKLADLEQEKSSLVTERDAARAELEEVRRALADRTAAEESATAKVTELEGKLAELEGNVRDAAQKHAEVVMTNASDVLVLREALEALEAKVATTNAQVTKLEEDLTAERSKVQTPAAAADVIAAIDADPFLNRGQKETIRMTYNQFTAKRRSS